MRVERDWRGIGEGTDGEIVRDMERWGVALLGNGSQGGAFFLRYCGVIGPESPRI